jgi:hypothetical protein
LFVGTNNILGESIPPAVHEEIINVYWDNWDDDHDDDNGASSNSDDDGGEAQAFAEGDDHTIWAWINHSIDWVCPCNVPSSYNPAITIKYHYLVWLDMDKPTGDNGAKLKFTTFVNDDERSYKRIDEENSELDIWPPVEEDYTKTYEMNNLVKDKTYHIGVNASVRTYSYGSLGHSELYISHTADSSSTRIEIKWENRPPNDPDLDGPTIGEVGTSYKYTAETTDPDKDRVCYKFDWGDGQTSDWSSYFDSGEEYSRVHIWQTQGNYDVRAKAKDEDYNTESKWTTLELYIPRNKPSGCLTGSKVLMYSGTSGYTKNIENISIGDIVQSYDALNQTMAPARVVGILTYLDNVCDTYSLLDNNLTVSSNHPIYINGSFGVGWFEAYDLEVGDLSLKKEPADLNLSWENISSISESSTTLGMRFYDLELLPLASDASGYWVNEVLVDSA